MHKKSHICLPKQEKTRKSRKWRDPDSNRGPHDLWSSCTKELASYRPLRGVG
jgi:hypothetical protein